MVGFLKLFQSKKNREISWNLWSFEQLIWSWVWLKMEKNMEMNGLKWCLMCFMFRYNQLTMIRVCRACCLAVGGGRSEYTGGSATKNGVKWIHHRRMRIEWEYIRMKKNRLIRDGCEWSYINKTGKTSIVWVGRLGMGFTMTLLVPWIIKTAMMLETQWTYHLGMICTSGGHKKSVET